MEPRIRLIHHFATCRGPGVLVGRGEPGAGFSAPGASPDLGLELAALMGEFEADGERISTIGIRLRARDDARWAQAALAWSHAHGRRTLLRTPVVMPRGLVRAAAEADATILLEMAHPHLEVQRALVGAHADPGSALLLQAQHLRTLELGVAAHLGPLLPAIHDQAQWVEPLLQHVAAADVHNVHLSVGQLGRGRLTALEPLLLRGELAGLMRAFRVRAVDAGPWRLSPAAHAGLYHAVRRLAQRHGLNVDVCGCPAQCHLDAGHRPAYVPVEGPELFGSAS